MHAIVYLLLVSLQFAALAAWLYSVLLVRAVGGGSGIVAFFRPLLVLVARFVRRSERLSRLLLRSERNFQLVDGFIERRGGIGEEASIQQWGGMWGLGVRLESADERTYMHAAGLLSTGGRRLLVHPWKDGPPPPVPERNDRSEDCIMFFHGRGGSIYEAARFEKYRLLHGIVPDRRTTVIAIDPHGIGSTDGFPDARSLREDVVHALRWADERGFRRSVLVGESLGGGIVAEGARAAVKRGVRVDAVVLCSTFSSLAAAIDSHPISRLLMPWDGVRRFAAEHWPIELDVASSIRALDRAGVPVHVLHGIDDSIIPVAHVYTMAFPTRRWTRATFQRIKNEDHEVMFTEEFAQRMRAVLANDLSIEQTTE